MPTERHRCGARGEQVGRRLRLLFGRCRRDLVLVGQVGEKLHALKESVVIEVEVGRVQPRRRPRHAVVHPEQSSRVGGRPDVDEAPLGCSPAPVPLGEPGGGIDEVVEAPRLVPPRRRRLHSGFVEQLPVVEQIISRPLLWKGVLTVVVGESSVERRDAVGLHLRGESGIAGQHGVEVQQHSPLGQLGVAELPHHEHVGTLAAGAERGDLLHRARPRQQGGDLDVRVPAPELVDDAQPGISFVRVGREEEGQLVAVATAAADPRCQR